MRAREQTDAKAGAEAAKLNADKLAAWVAYLDKARGSIADPLHGIFKVAFGQSRGDALAAMRKLEADTTAQAKSVKIIETVEECLPLFNITFIVTVQVVVA